MAKSQDELLEDALAHFQLGKSTRDCEKLTGINYKKIDREAKKRGILKGEASQLLLDKIKVEREFVTKSESLRQVIDKAIDDLDFFKTLSMKNAKLLSEKLNESTSIIEHKAAQETINLAMKGASVVPYYPNAANITQSNGVQVNSDCIEAVNWNVKQ